MTARILFVEDDAAGANRLLHLLATEGYAVEWACSADRARTLLTAARPADWDLVISAALARWSNDLRLSLTTASFPPLTAEQVQTLYECAVADGRRAPFVIYGRASGAPIGTTYLREIDRRNRTAEFGIDIGKVAYRGRGYGTEKTG